MPQYVPAVQRLIYQHANQECVPFKKKKKLGMPDERKMPPSLVIRTRREHRVHLRRYKSVNRQKPKHREHSGLYQAQNQAPCWPIPYLKGFNTSVIKLPHSKPQPRPAHPKCFNGVSHEYLTFSKKKKNHKQIVINQLPHCNEQIKENYSGLSILKKLPEWMRIYTDI